MKNKKRSRKKFLFMLSFFITVFFISTFAQNAITFTVNTTDDLPDVNPGDGIAAASNGTVTIRAAIEESNTITTYPPAIIRIPQGNYVLQNASLEITRSMFIQGDGPITTVIDGNNRSQIFHIIGTNNAIVSISGLTIQHGFATTQIQSGTGGGINIEEHASLNLIQCAVVDNETDWQGGGILNQGFLFISECDISGNDAPGSNETGVEGSAGGIWNNASLQINRTLISRNRGTRGGGILNAGNLEITNSTISGNMVTGLGGGIYNDGVASIAFCTITQNQASVAPWEAGRNAPVAERRGGGGIFNASGTISMGSTILAQNTHVGANSFTANFSPDALSKTYTQQTINSQGQFVDTTFTPFFTSFRNNIIGDLNANCNFADETWGDTRFDTVGFDSLPLDPLITPLGDFGGPTLTHSPYSLSPAIDRAIYGTSASFFDCPGTDQRGQSRPADGDFIGTVECDIGAVEFNAAVPSNAFEAENGTIGARVLDLSDPSASNGHALTVQQGDGDQEQLQITQKSTYLVNLMTEGVYLLYASVASPAKTGNALFVQIDGFPSGGYRWDLPGISSTYTSFPMSDRGTGTVNHPQTDRVAIALPAGTHTLNVFLREDGTKLDKVSMELVAATKVTCINDATTGSGLNQFEYCGNWLTKSQESGFYHGDEHYSNCNGASYKVRFYGTRVKVYSTLHPSNGISAYTIDGCNETKIDQYSPISSRQKLVYTSNILPLGFHELKVRVTGQKNVYSGNIYAEADRVDIITTQPAPNKWYKIACKATMNHCFDVAGGCFASGTHLQLWCKNNINQEFAFKYAGNGYYQIVCRGNTGYAVDVSGGRYANGTKMQIWSSDANNPNQRFKLIDLGKGINRIESSNPVFSLDNGGATVNGERMTIWTSCDQNVNQMFVISEVP